MTRLAPDQAEGLRRLFVPDARRMIALIGRGAQDAVLPAQLAAALASQGRKVLLLDETLTAGRAHGVFGVVPSCDLEDVLHGQTDIADAIKSTMYGVDVLAGGNRAATLTRPRMEARIGLVNAFYRLAGQYDVVLVHAAESAFRRDPSFVWACQDVIVRCHDHAEAMTRAYGCIKSLQQAGERRFHLLFEAIPEAASQLLFRRLAAVCRRHLQLMPDCLGVLSDGGVLEEGIAQQVLNWPLPEQQDGHFPALMRRLLRGQEHRAVQI